jgi:hypothetical protein
MVTLQTITDQKFVEVEKDMIITWSKFGTIWRMLKNFPLKLFACPLHSS